MIRVLQIGMNNVIGGIENYLINYYRNIDKKIIQFDFINIYSNNLCFQDELENNGGKIYKVSNYYKHPFKYLKEVINIIKMNDYKIVHCNMNSAVMLYPLIAAKIAGVEFIIAHSHNSSSDKGIIKSLLHNINKHFIPLFANQFFACSKKAGEWFFSRKILNSDKFYIINNAINLEKFNFDEKVRRKKRKDLQIKDDEILIGHVGRFYPQKNQKFLVEIFDLYYEKNQNSKLILIGDGPNLEKVKKYVSNKNIKNKVIFLGKRDDVNELMMAMDVFILPSLYEGLPLVGIEAQKSGLLCLFSENVTQEVKISNNVKFISLKNKESFVKEIKKCSRENVYSNEFDIKICAKKLTNLYLNLIEKGDR